MQIHRLLFILGVVVVGLGTLHVFASSEHELEMQLREPGDWVLFQGYKVTRLDGDYHSDETEGEVADYFRSLDLPAETFDEYKRIKAEAWAPYNRRVDSIVKEAERVFGHDIGIIVENDLKDLFDSAWKTYDDSLLKLLGNEGYKKFDAFREYRRTLAVERHEYAPN